MRKLAFVIVTLFLSQNALAIHPSRDYAILPSQVGVPYDSLNIVTSDHIRLTGWYFKPKVDTSHLLMIIAGGDAGNMSYELPLVQFIMMNFHVPILLFDYRGFGSSDPFAYDSNAIGHPEYLTDLDGAVQLAKKNHSGKKIIIYGRSLGASLALVEGSMRSDVQGIIAESPYIVQDSMKNRFEALNPSRTIKPIRSALLEPSEHVKDFHVPHLLVLHGAAEKYILLDDLKQYTGTVPIADKKLVDFPGCDHLELPMKATQQFGNVLYDFLSRL